MSSSEMASPKYGFIFSYLGFLTSGCVLPPVGRIVAGHLLGDVARRRDID